MPYQQAFQFRIFFPEILPPGVQLILLNRPKNEFLTQAKKILEQLLFPELKLY
jgi:hypothetical protein